MSVQEAAVSLLQRVLFYVGIDWAAETHAVCVLDATGRIRAQFTIGHTAAGFADLLRRLARLTGDPAEVAVGIERPDGRLVDVLLEAGYPVVPVSPNAIKTWRDGEVLSGAKSDAGDAAVIAEYLRLRAHRLQPATPYTAQTKALRTVVRTREDVVDMRVAAANQLSALLDAHWPGAKAIFADVESAIALAFLTRYPTYPSAQHLGEKRLRAFCVKHGYSGRRAAAELLTRLRAAPAGSTDEALTDAVRDAVLAQVAVLTALTAAEKNLGRSVVAHLGEHPDAAIFTSLPRSRQINSRPGARRVGRFPRSLRLPGRGRGAGRGHPGHQSIRQVPCRAFPVGLQQTPPQGDHLFRRQQPTRQPLGRRCLRPGDRPRPRPPARGPGVGPRLDPGHLPLLDRRCPLRPEQTRQRRQTPRDRYRGLTTRTATTVAAEPLC